MSSTKISAYKFQSEMVEVASFRRILKAAFLEDLASSKLLLDNLRHLIDL